MSSTSPRILTVCTANICRSPMMERLLRRALPEASVESSGTFARVGAPLEERAGEVLRTLGADPTGFEGRQLEREHIDSADLVITASREHRAAVARLDPRAVRRTFTLRELARLVEGLGPLQGPTLGDRVPELAQRAAALRGIVRGDRPEDDDLADPYGRRAADFEVCARTVCESLVVPLRLLRGGLGPEGSPAGP